MTMLVIQMETEDNLDELVQIVFSKPAQAPKSIQLQLDDTTYDTSVIPEIFTEIAKRGTKRLFGVDVMQMTETQTDILEEYMQSMGVTMRVTCNFGERSPFEVLAANGHVHNIQVVFDWLS